MGPDAPGGLEPEPPMWSGGRIERIELREQRDPPPPPEGTSEALLCRLYVGGELIESVWLRNDAATDGVQSRHEQLTLAADRAGKLWLIEIYDPDAPADEAFLRFGTDIADGMVDPAGPLADYLPDYLKGGHE